jgi:anti-anti-sigma factor
MSAAFTGSEKLPIGAPHRPTRFTSSLIGSTMVLVTSEGEIDACNARGLAAYIEGVLAGKRRLILDLRGLTFFGTPGFSALHYVHVTCSRRDVNWVLVPGAEVSRILRICDPQQRLPVADTLEHAIAAVGSPPRNHLRPLQRT